MILSVLLPFKDSESYFQDCLDSLTNQTFQDFELIAVNDGSKDQSSNILKKWAKSRPHGVREIAGPCQGIGMALKTGAQFCRGDFIARMDSDDTCDPCRFEVQIGALHKVIVVLGKLAFLAPTMAFVDRFSLKILLSTGQFVLNEKLLKK